MKSPKLKPQRIPLGFIPFQEAVRALPGPPVTPQRWHKLRMTKRIQGARWDGHYWWVPPGGIVVLPGKTENGRPRG